LTQLPSTLPTALEVLECQGNNLTALPPLHDGLQTLACFDNLLTGLPSPLPGSLQILDCSYNLITGLPALPESLIWFWCEFNLLTGLPVLPDGLGYLNCSGNPLAALPALPDSLQYLECYDNGLTGLPALPAGLVGLDCSDNKLPGLPLPLPSGLIGLDISNNLITAQPYPLPDGMRYFYCDYNRITSINVANCSYSLEELSVTGNPLTELILADTCTVYLKTIGVGLINVISIDLHTESEEFAIIELQAIPGANWKFDSWINEFDNDYDGEPDDYFFNYVSFDVDEDFNTVTIGYRDLITEVTVTAKFVQLPTTPGTGDYAWMMIIAALSVLALGGGLLHYRRRQLAA
ncbi:MAG: hypothetical protein FWD45_03130, partial [Coriobacteriia bacterium]|nr:hypothetical protein [Coriobacteriia bacterium]